MIEFLSTSNLPVFLESCVPTNAFRKAGKRIPFDKALFRNPVVAFQWLSLGLDIPAVPLVSRFSYAPSVLKPRVLRLRPQLRRVAG